MEEVDNSNRISFIEELAKIESIAKYFSAEIGPNKTAFMRYELKVLITWVNPRSWGGKGS